MELVDKNLIIDEYNKSNGTISDLMDIILDAPVVDVMAIIHSKWCYEYKSGFKPYNGVVCNHCYGWNDRTTDFCPCCGAKMDGGE